MFDAHILQAKDAGAASDGLRICHVITRMIVGGAQENTLLTVRGLVERGHQVVLATGPTAGPEGALLEQTEVGGGGVVLEEPALTRALSPLKDWRAYNGLYDYFRANDFDVVHTHSSKAGILGRLAACNARVPVIVHTVHGQPFHPYQSRILNRFYIAAERFAAKRCHHICAVAQAMVDQCVAAGIASQAKYSVVYSGMELEPYLVIKPDCGLRSELGIPPDSPVVGKVARLFELKGHDLLLRAAPAIVHAHPKVRFLLVGDGDLRETLMQKVEAMGLADNFVFAGLVPPKDVSRYVSLMDCLVHLSLREGLPRALVQASAAAVPSVAFDLDGAPEVIESGRTGWLCAAKDVDAVAVRVNSLLADPAAARAMGLKARELVRHRFDWRLMVEHLETLYRNLLATTAPMPGASRFNRKNLVSYIG